VDADRQRSAAAGHHGRLGAVSCDEHRRPLLGSGLPVNQALTINRQKSWRPHEQEFARVIDRSDPSARAMPDGLDPEPRVTTLLQRERRVLFGLAVAIMGLGIIAITQSFHSSVLANNAQPEVRRIVPAEPAIPVQTRAASRVNPAEAGFDSLLFQPPAAIITPMPSDAFKREAKPTVAPASKERRHAVSRSASCEEPMPKNAWLDICG
jgi:hypothetical protein